ncbi:MAG: hypothetical protein AB8B81_06940 [Halioglobus sp.]
MHDCQTNKKALVPLIRSLLFLLLIVCTPAQAYKSELKAAKEYLDIGAHVQSLEQFQLALQNPKLSGRKRERALADVVKLKLLIADQKFRLGKKLESADEEIGALNAYRRASEYAPENSEYSAHFSRLDSTLDSARAQAQELLSSARTNGSWGSSFSALKSLSASSAVPEVRFSLDQLKSEAASFYSQQSDLALSQRRYQGALEAISEAVRYSDSAELQNKKLARHHLLLSQLAWDDGRSNAAFEQLNQGLSFEPNNPELLAYQSRFESQWLGMLYNEAIAASGQGQLQLARSKFTQISRYQPGYLDVSEQLNQLNQTLVSDYYQRAETLMRENKGEAAGRALAYYMVAADQQASLYPDIYSKISSAKTRLREDLEFRISLNVKNSSSEPGASGIVRDNVLSALKGSSLNHVKVLERETLDDILREQGLGQAFFDQATAVQVKKIKGIQAGLYIDVVKMSVHERGRDRPSFGSVQYVSGTRFVPNPRHNQLQQEVAIAQQRVIETQQNANKAKADQNRLLGMSKAGANDAATAIASIGSIFSSAGASSGHTAAKRELENLQYALAGEQPQVEEDVYSDFRYKIFDLELSGEVILSYKIVNFTTSEVGDAQAVNAVDLISDRYVPGDPGKGIATDPIQLPGQEVFKKQLLDQAMASLISGLEVQLGAGSGNYLRQAQFAVEDGNSDSAVENYIRYLYSGADLKSLQARAANDYLYEQLGIQLLRRKK